MNTEDENKLFWSYIFSTIGGIIITMAIFLGTMSLCSCSTAWHVGDRGKEQKLQNWHDQKMARKYEKKSSKVNVYYSIK